MRNDVKLMLNEIFNEDILSEAPVVSGFIWATEKDFERARGLEWKGSTFGLSLVDGNAQKMAKLIKNELKLLQRIEAVWDVWGDSAMKPFAEKIPLLVKDKKLVDAFYHGVSDADPTYMSIPKNPYSDKKERFMWFAGYKSKKIR